MPVWAIQSTGEDEEWVEGGMLATESGALVALSLEGLILRAWAPGQWLTVRHVEPGRPEPLANRVEEPNVVSALPRG